MSIFYQNRLEDILFFTSYNNSSATHLHRQVELIIALEGTLSLTIDHANHTLTSGHIAIIFPNQLHSLNTCKNSKVLLCIFNIDFCQRFRNYFQKSTPDKSIFSLADLSAHSLLAINGLLTLTQEWQRGEAIPDKVQSYANGYLSLLLTDLFLHITLTPKSNTDSLELEQQLLIYLDAHYTEALSLETLAREFGVSRFVLSRLFTDKLHISFPHYVNTKRLEYSKILLKSTNLSVTQVALDAGFGSSRTFFREFSNAFHLSPGAYRKQQLHP